MKPYAFAAALALSMIAAHPAFAGAPAGLLNKTIRVSYVTTTTAHFEGSTRDRPFSRTVARTIYVSSLGRIFVKRTDASLGGKLSHDRKGSPDISGKYFHFQGRSLVIIVPAGRNSAREVVVSFSGDFGSCSVEVRTGRSGGGERSWTGLNGRRLVASGGSTFSNASCSISAGNPFAQ